MNSAQLKRAIQDIADYMREKNISDDDLKSMIKLMPVKVSFNFWDLMEIYGIQSG